MELKPFMPIKALANEIGVPYSFIYKKVRAGEVAAVRSGKKYYVNTGDFLRHVNCDTNDKESV